MPRDTAGDTTADVEAHATAGVWADGDADVEGLRAVVARLEAAGCVAAPEEADELVAAAARCTAGGSPAATAAALEALVDRRVAGEPLAWITGEVTFCGERVVVHPGVYVPRWQSEALARRGVELLAGRGLAADLCTGSGAVAVVLQRARPDARVVATDTSPAACRCAAANGVDVRWGSLADPVLPALAGRCDLVTAVPPYVPTDQLAFLPRDARDHEPRDALDGGGDGLAVAAGVLAAAARLLRPGGALLVELGADQDDRLAGRLEREGFMLRRRLEDEDGDLRGIEAVRHSA